MLQVIFRAKNESDTEFLGQALAQVLPDGVVISLLGTLGAGKTRLVQAVAESEGVPSNTVSSPTFVLIREYREGRRPIYHFDAYRLRDDDEFLELGPDEYFDSEGLSFVEWGDRVEGCLPANRLQIQISISDADERLFEIVSIGCKYDSVIKKLQTLLQ